MKKFSSDRKRKLIDFEHKKEKLIPFREFKIRVLRFSLIALLLIAISAVIGTLGYHFFGKLNYIDSFYNACMILTGMGPVNVMETKIAKLFSSFYALYSGIAFLSITAIFFSPIAHRLLHILHIDRKDNENEND
jgi:hypothetical protein